ncbi:MAG: prepilin-type N-terminal cleavage/methylation domain-containing protein [Firmicutes bacterium]|nr:prepilin-type N-terminal cleavage/methylation domain-containing protein [Bacillota bacterium]
MPLREEKGFTLVEVVVALIVLSVITIAVVTIYNNGIIAIISSGKRTEAVYEVQAKLERALLEDPGEVEAGEEPAFTIVFPDLEPIEIYAEEVTAESDTTYGPSQRKVSAVVYIPKRQGD